MLRIILLVNISSLLFILFCKEGQTKNSGKQAGNCCRRIPHSYVIGYGITGQPTRLDVGRCSAACGDTSHLQSDNYVSVLERLRRREDGSATEVCHIPDTRGQATCEPSLVHVEAVTFNRGPKFFDVIDQCVCRKSPKRCRRIPKLKRFFIGTKYEATVDIGECNGGCRKERSGKTCRATRAESQPIAGPNGIITVQSVAECRCEPTCYRQQFNVAVTEKGGAENEGQESEGHELRTKVIDVGRCVGTCGPIGRCVVRSKKSNNKCLMSLETNDVTCAPVRVHDVTYTNRDGEKERVARIRRCGCT